MWFSQLAFQSSVYIYHINRYSSCDQFKDHITFLTVTCMWSSHLVLWHSSAECTCTSSARPTCMLAFSTSLSAPIRQQPVHLTWAGQGSSVMWFSQLPFQSTASTGTAHVISSRTTSRFSVTCMWSSHLVLWHSSAECTCQSRVWCLQPNTWCWW